MSKTKLVITDTFHLSQIAEELTRPRKDGSAPTKQAALNTIARSIAGPKHDWGYLTGTPDLTIQKGLRAPLPAVLAATDDAAPQETHKLRLVDRTRPYVSLLAKPAPLLSAEHAALMNECFEAPFIAISERFHTDTDAEVACMFDPLAICVEEDGLAAHLMFGASAQNMRRWGPAWFASSSNKKIDTLTMSAILDMQAQTSGNIGAAFRTIHFPHALIVMDESPFIYLKERLGGGEDEVDTEIARHPFRIFIDETLNGIQKARVLEQIEDCLNRFAVWHSKDVPKAIFGNITVMHEAGA